jgi:Rha family phage regulatory protein
MRTTAELNIFTKQNKYEPLPDRSLALVKVKNGALVTDSLIVAEVFEKNHFDVLKSIEKLECSQEFRDRNFTCSNYMTLQGKSQPCFEMTRDGFTFLAMGFTGGKAAAWKEKYIIAFNAMEETQIKGSTVLERNLVVLTELHKGMQESVNNGFGIMNTRIVAVETKVDSINHKVSSIEMQIQNQNKRKNIKDSVKSLIAKHISMLGGKCPCCGFNQVTDIKGMPIKGCEYDHFYQNSLPGVEYVWLICGNCHKELTHGKVARGDRQIEFNAFQNKRKRLPDSQTSLLI